MIKTAIPDTNLRFCNKLEELLGRFPLAKESDRIQVISRNDKIAISYLTEENLRFNQTCFDLELRENICDILVFDIKEEQRRKDYGRTLYSIIEEFARYFDYKKIQTSPSGEGIAFWPCMGFTKRCKNGTEKILS